MGGAAVGGIVATGVAGGTVAVASVAGTLDLGSDGNPVPVLKDKFLVAWRQQISGTIGKQELVARATQVVQQDVPKMAVNSPARVKRSNQAVQGLWERHDCDHQYWKYVSGAHRCEECMKRLPKYVFECRQCRSLACNRCRKRRI